MGSDPSNVPYEQAPILFDTTPNESRLSYYHFLLSTFTCKYVCLHSELATPITSAHHLGQPPHLRRR